MTALDPHRERTITRIPEVQWPHEEGHLATLVNQREGHDRNALCKRSVCRDRGGRLAIEPKDACIAKDPETTIEESTGKSHTAAVIDGNVIEIYEPGPDGKSIAWVEVAEDRAIVDINYIPRRNCVRHHHPIATHAER